MIRFYVLMHIAKKYFPDLDLERFKAKISKKTQYTLKSMLSTMFEGRSGIESQSREFLMIK